MAWDTPPAEPAARVPQGAEAFQHIEVRPSNGALGAEVVGVDLSRPLADEVFAEIRRAWLAHQMIFFREQRITPAQQVEFARRFGELAPYPMMEPLPDQPLVIPVIKEKGTKFNFGGGWHSDTPYQERPPSGTMLYALDVPTRGGDTLYADAYGAYETLSDGMKELLGPLLGVYTASKVHGKSGFYSKADHPMALRKGTERAEERYLHPIVRTHPETGRKSLYASIPHLERFDRMSVSESKPLMDFLGRHVTQAELTYRFTWRVGSLALWDNRCVQHYALNDYPGQRREMHRVTIRGERPA